MSTTPLRLGRNSSPPGCKSLAHARGEPVEGGDDGWSATHCWPAIVQLHPLDARQPCRHARRDRGGTILCLCAKGHWAVRDAVLFDALSLAPGYRRHDQDAIAAGARGQFG